MATTIKLKNSVTTTNVPSSLAQGEVAINVTDKKVWVGNAATTPVQLLGTGADGSLSTLTVGAGTVSAPAITTSGDTNTGIFFPAADTIAFTEGGAESMRIDSSGRVLIGTTTVGISASGSTALSIANGTTQVFASLRASGGQEMLLGADSTNGVIFGSFSNNDLIFRTNNSERMRIDSSGNVGIGTSSPSYKLHVVGGQTRLDVSSAGTSLVCLGTGSNFQVDHSTSGYATLINSANSGAAMIFKGSSESMRIDTSGNLLVGTTSRVNNERLSVKQTGGGAWPLILLGEDRGAVFRITASSGYAAYFERNNGTFTGDIFITSSGTTTYNTASDYRLKENIAPMIGALNKVAQLKPCTYTWKADGATSEGFIAHEVQEIFPQAVRGIKDEIDAQGKPQYQGIDTSFLVATLTAAIQELKAEVDALKAQINQ
jgi:hypothetical protein